MKLQKLDFLSTEKRVIRVHKKNVKNLIYLEYFSKLIEIEYTSDEENREFLNNSENYFEHLSVIKLKNSLAGLYSAWNLAENLWQKHNYEPILKIREDDFLKGRKILSKMKIPHDAWFVTLHVREGKKETERSKANAKIESYMDGIREITRKKGYVIRIGDKGTKPLPKIKNVFDYANSEFKSEFMDIFLLANCRFHIGTASGPASVPPVFGRPILYTNCPCIGLNPNFLNSVMIPKLYFNKKEKKFLTFNEMLRGNMAWTVNNNCLNTDVKTIDNTENDIKHGIIEMLEMTESSKKIEETSLQSRFDQARNRYGDTGQTKISKYFIEKNRNLLE